MCFIDSKEAHKNVMTLWVGHFRFVLHSVRFFMVFRMPSSISGHEGASSHGGLFLICNYLSCLSQFLVIHLLR